MKAVIALEDGTVFEGESFGTEGEITGEVVFNTGMTGYQEILTDPSYFGQIVTMTYPLIGNYGINIDDFESSRPHVSGFIVRELCRTPNNWRSAGDLNEYLLRHGIIGLEGIDTRAITKILRDNGTMKGMLSTSSDFCCSSKIDSIVASVNKDPVLKVTTDKVRHYEADGHRIALIDYGVKQSIITSLLKRGCEVYVFPATSSADEVISVDPDGIVLSNGPGDPKDCGYAIMAIKNLLGKKPILGICLGHQLIALARGADAERLKYGHRGCNHPVKDLKKDITYITSQNHGYTIIESTVDTRLMEVSHRNMNDGTIEGIRHNDIPVLSVQFHPEASPGPGDTAYLFDEFMLMIGEIKADAKT